MLVSARADAAADARPAAPAGMYLSNLLVRRDQAMDWIGRLSAPDAVVRYVDLTTPSEYVYLAFPDGVRTQDAHQRFARVFEAAGLNGDASGDALRALYRGGVTDPPGYADRYLVMNPGTGTASISPTPRPTAIPNNTSDLGPVPGRSADAGYDWFMRRLAEPPSTPASLIDQYLNGAPDIRDGKKPLVVRGEPFRPDPLAEIGIVLRDREVGRRPSAFAPGSGRNAFRANLDEFAQTPLGEFTLGALMGFYGTPLALIDMAAHPNRTYGSVRDFFDDPFNSEVGKRLQEANRITPGNVGHQVGGIAFFGVAGAGASQGVAFLSRAGSVAPTRGGFGTTSYQISGIEPLPPSGLGNGYVVTVVARGSATGGPAGLTLTAGRASLPMVRGPIPLSAITVVSLDWVAVIPKKGPYKGQPRDVHVRLHNIDNPAKPQHGVFVTDGVALTNEAWARGHFLGLRPDAAGNLSVPMGRVVGRLGGQEGIAVRAAGNPTELTSIYISVRPGTAEIITAFPTR